MADEEIQSLERLVLSDDKEEALRSFPSASDFKYYMEGNFLLLRNANDPRLEELLKLLQRNSSLSSKLELRSLIKKYEETQSAEVLEQINRKYLHLEFNHPAPRSVQSQEVEKFPSTLEISFPDLAQAATVEKVFLSTTSQGKLRIPIGDTNDTVFKKLLSTGDLYNYKGLPKRFASYFESCKAFTENECFKNMSLTQIHEIGKLVPKVWGNEVFVKTFLMKEHFAKLVDVKDEQKYEALKAITAEVLGDPRFTDGVRTVMLLNVLTLEMKLGKTEEHWFMNYLLFHRENAMYINSKQQIRKFLDDLLVDPSISDNTILEYYLNALIQKTNSIDQFKPYIKLQILKLYHARILILRGEPIENIEKEFQRPELLTSIELEPCLDNPKEFTRTEIVKFAMNIKNVPRLLVKVLEINPKNYYLTKNRAITTNLKLDGLVAKSEYSYEYSDQPQVRVRREFEFPELQDKAGMFFIEFFGNGRHSRVIIKKGSLRYVSKATISGHSVYVLNEDNEICKQNTGVYLDSRFYAASPDDGRIDLPFARTVSVKNLILTDGVITEFFSSFSHMTENYELKCAFLVHEEQLLSGAHTLVYVKPGLFINGNSAPIELLKEVSIQSNTSDIDGVSSIKSYADLNYVNDSYEIEVDVRPRLTNFNLEVKAHVQNTDGDRVELSCDFILPISSSQSGNNTSSAFLRLTSEGFLVEVLGKNGEPVTRQRAGVKVLSALWKDPITKTLQTDDNGQIHLGKLDQVNTLTVTLTKEGLADEFYEWNIWALKGKSEYPSEVKICEGDNFGLPLVLRNGEKLEETVSLFSVTSDEKVVNDVTGSLSYNVESSMVVFSKVEIGKYLLIFKNNLDLIRVEVLEGVHLDQTFILQESAAVVTSKDYSSIAIKDIRTNESEVEVEIAGYCDKNSKVYGLFFNFITADLLKFPSELLKLNEVPQVGKINFARAENVYVPSTKLDEEYQYVLDRKNRPRFVGSTLDKPQLLLKRLLVQETKTDTQQAQLGGNFNENNLYSAMDHRMKSQVLRSQGLIRKTVSISVDFLKDSAKWVIAPLQNNVAKVKLEPNYSNLLVICYNDVGISYQIQPLAKELQRKDLRLSKSALNSTVISKAKAFAQEEVLKIEDFSSASVEVFDSFEKIFKLLVVAIENARINLSSPLTDWEFLVNWPKLSYIQKKELFDKFVSHELNLFLYYRDPEFFNKIVKPFITCKMNKDLVDKYLCGESLEDWRNFERICNLSYLEMALVADRLKSTERDFAEKIGKKLKKVADSENIEKKIEPMLEIILNAQINSGINSGSPREMFEADEQSSVLEEMECGRDLPELRERCESSKREILIRPVAPKLYKKLEETKEFCETYYYKVLGKPNFGFSASFCSDLCQSYLQGSSLLTKSLLSATNCLAESIVALSVLDVPYKPEKHEYSSDGKSWQITLKSPALIVYRELTNSDVNISSSIIVAAKYFESTEQEVEVKQFIREKIYKCLIVITNTSGQNLTVSTLVQVPEGSIPLSPPQYSKLHTSTIAGYTTISHLSYFYFPSSGVFAHHPATVAVSGQIIAIVGPHNINVLDQYDVSKLESFNDLVISGRKDLILDYLRKQDLDSLEKIYWLFKYKDFWNELIGIYREKFSYDYWVWAYSVFHNDKAGLTEFLSISQALNQNLGYFFKSGIISTGSEDFKHLEFDPLVNARAYKLGNQERITNNRFKEVYKNYLYYLAEKMNLENADLLCLCQYLILQERYQEASEIYSRISLKPSSSELSSNELQIQFDYITCYLDLEKARTIAPLYEDYPVIAWNKHFNEVNNLLKEINAEMDDNVVVANKEPTLNFVVENNQIVLNYESVQQCTIRIYEIDLEILFSKNPFLIKDTQSFGYVKANSEMSLALTGNSFAVGLEEYKGKNILIEVDYKTYSLSKSHFSNLLSINCIERFGMIKVMDKDRKPRPAVYVKAFVKRKNGVVEFYKDGYTDVRGKFDYVSLNTDTLATIEKFALLVVDDSLGSLVHEASPPPQ